MTAPGTAVTQSPLVQRTSRAVFDALIPNIGTGAPARAALLVAANWLDEEGFVFAASRIRNQL